MIRIVYSGDPDDLRPGQGAPAMSDEPTPRRPSPPRRALLKLQRPQALRAVHTPNFPALLRRLGASLLVTTYQAGKLVMVRDEGGSSIPITARSRPRWAWH